MAGANSSIKHGTFLFSEKELVVVHFMPKKSSFCALPVASAHAKPNETTCLANCMKFIGHCQRALKNMFGDGTLAPVMVASEHRHVVRCIDKFANIIASDVPVPDVVGTQWIPVMPTGFVKFSEVSIDWRQQVPVPFQYSHLGASISDSTLRAISLRQLNDLGAFIQKVLDQATLVDTNSLSVSFAEQVSWATINLYHIDTYFVKLLTSQFKCSFVELITSAPQPPLWFISHAWSTPFQHTLRMLNFHAQQRFLRSSDTYWMCTFANNQHNLAELNDADVLSTPFAKAIMRKDCLGTIMLMDTHCTPFKRMWCILENFVTTEYGRRKACPHLLDIGTMIPEGTVTARTKFCWTSIVPESAALLCDNGVNGMKEYVETWGARLPDSIALAGAEVNIHDATASRPEDRANIFRLINEHTSVYAVNRAIRKVFAPAACGAAARRNDVQTLRHLLVEQELCEPNQTTHIARRTPLHAAANLNHVDAIRFLLEARANVNAATEFGNGPAFCAASDNSLEALSLLLASRADPDQPCWDRATGKLVCMSPIQIARWNGNAAAEQLLKEAGGKNCLMPFSVLRTCSDEGVVKVLV